MGKRKISNLKINIPASEKSKFNSEQRTEEWQQLRKGRWTGSAFKNLMSCSSAGGKKSWADFDKVFYFGKTAIKYAFANAMERKTGKYVDEGEGTKPMRYGTKVEPLIAKMTKKILKEKGIKGKFEDVSFKVFEKLPTVGVSSDAVLKKKGSVISSVEMKACVSWSSYYDRTFEVTDEKSTDFWQMQGQMLAWGVNKCYYVTAEPPKNINDYLYADNIIDLYKQFKKECPVNVELVKASENHQIALLRRVVIAERAIEEWLKEGENFKTSFYKSIDYYNVNQGELLKILI